MAGPNPTQKQIAEKYKGNLDYFRKGHYYRRLRLILFLVAVVGSIGAVLTFGRWGKEEVFSTGPISANHAKFANDCQACHEGAEPDLLKVPPFNKLVGGFESAKQLSFDKVKAAAGDVNLPSLETLQISAEKMKAAANKDKLGELVQHGLEVASLSNMDRACLKCHEALDLHQPQATVLALGAAFGKAALVHAGACSSCHREHVGHQPMKLPGSESCEMCHNDSDALQRTRQLLDPVALARLSPKAKPAAVQIPPTGANVDVGEGLIRFLAPKKADAKPVVFKSYESGHPPFDYEQEGLRDPAKIKFNHARHEQADVSANGRKLECLDCHKPGGNGVFVQPVSYDQHCRSCHSLNLVPEYPELVIPHGRAEHVMHFLDPSTLTVKYRDALVARGMNDPALLTETVKQEFETLRQRMVNFETLQERVFLTGDPPQTPGNARLTPRTNKGQFFAGCAKCHEVTREPSGTWQVSKTNIAERWVHRGPFTHLPHQHMQCTDCHDARTSELTSDVLMPKQTLCAECHRAPAPGTSGADGFAVQRAELKPNSPELAAAQRRDGGVRADCQTCHAFHAPPRALEVLQAGK